MIRWLRRKFKRERIIKISTNDTLFDIKMAIIVLLICVGIMLILSEAYS